MVEYLRVFPPPSSMPILLMVKATMKSNPAGFVSEVVSYMDLNTTFTTGDLHGESNGYHFAYWTVNGVRQAGMTGVSSAKST